MAISPPARTTANEDDPGSGETAVRRRTRIAILEAAVSAWARDISASLGDIADRAGVARSTLHRYFPDRDALLAQAYRHAYAQLEQAYGAPRPGARAIDELTDSLRASTLAGDAVVFLFADPHRFAGVAGADDDDEYPDPETVALVQRAQAEGSIDPEVHPAWVVTAMYSLVYAAAELVGQDTLPLHRAGDLVVRTLLHGVGTEAPRSS